MLNRCFVTSEFDKNMESACIDYKDTGYFSQTVIDYLDDIPELRSFYSHRPDLKGFADLLNSKKVIADREVLVNVLDGQYQQNGLSTAYHAQLALENIALLKSKDTNTITT